MGVVVDGGLVLILACGLLGVRGLGEGHLADAELLPRIKPEFGEISASG